MHPTSTCPGGRATNVKLIVQPGDGAKPLIKAIRKARRSVEIVIFRFDRNDVERALVDAVERGVFVHALIAFTNRGGEKHLRDLETGFLAKGITVARTAGDLVRYHGKMLIVDRQELYVLAFNFTHLDMEHARSFGVVTRNPKLVQEAVRLFESDTKRQEYSAGSSKFIVSPVNSRKQLAAFLKGAKRELLIYDPKITDKEILRILNERREAGVKIRVIGQVSGKRLRTGKLTGARLHTRTIIRDHKQAFLGSQSLCALELDRRREIGIIFRDTSAIAELVRIFEKDWKRARKEAARPSKVEVGRAAKELAKVVHRQLPVRPVVNRVLRAMKKHTSAKLHSKHAEKIVRDAIESTVKDAVKEAATEVMKDVVEEPAEA